MLLKMLQGDAFHYRGLSAAVMQVAGVDKVSLQSQDWTRGGMISAGLSKDQDTNGFSSSLPLLFQEKLKVTTSFGDKYGDIGGDTMNDEALNGEILSLAISDLLPDDEDELLAGIDGGIDSLAAVNYGMEETDDIDLFSSGGGLEMDGEAQECFGMYVKNSRGVDGYLGNGCHGSLNGPGSMIGEHPYGEHPSRTLFVRNINSNVEDSELRTLFEHYGDIRTLYTACKHRGFVMISYYDIRAARSAMRALQNKPLRRRKLDIHFSIPKDNPSDKDINQGTLVVFNLDASVSNDDLRQIFAQYGEVKEIRETPHKRHHKFIEFYDVRAADAALRALNRSNIAGKRIKLEPSRPGGARRSLMQQLSHELEQDEVRSFWQQSSPPVTESPPGHTSGWGHFDSSVERPLPHSVRMSKPLPGLPIPPFSGSLRAGTIGSHVGRNKPNGSLGMKGVYTQHPHSLPEYDTPLYNPSSYAAVQGGLSCHGMHNATEGFGIQRTTSDASLFECSSGAIGTQGGSLSRLNSGSGGNASLSGSQFLWGSTGPYQQSSHPTMSHSLNVVGRMGIHGHFVNHMLPTHRPYAGSDPSGDATFLERQLGYLRASPDTVSLGLESPFAARVHGTSYANGGNHDAVGSANIRTLGGFESSALPFNLSMMPPPRRSHLFHPAPGLSSLNNADMIVDHVRIRRGEGSLEQGDGRKQYELDIGRILHGEDRRTTLMIKNIPNKYSAKMLCAAIDESHRGMYDFFYLPIDFKNKCNVGYAFINMTSPDHIVGLHKVLNGKKWEKFNSEKVASLAYARIQGKAALVAHFQNSSLMNEDKRCRPILFQHGELGNGEVVHVPLGVDMSRDQRSNGEPEGTNCNIAECTGSSAGGSAPGSPEE